LKLLNAEQSDRRYKKRFRIRRELSYKVMERGKIVHSGVGTTLDIGSGGVAFRADRPVATGASIELSIGWPALLDDFLPMRLRVSGRVQRVEGSTAVCAVDAYEFRTQGAAPIPAHAEKSASSRRWTAASSAAGL